tara:strand:- start:37153 stop:37368 length:216 start_codon:yes stop_codon:yes gene_type:complete
MIDKLSQSLATRAIHGSSNKDIHGSPHTPIYNITTHHRLMPEERIRRGISDAMLRPSVGLEDAADLQQVLA